jgi:hypothetical protein
MSDRGDWLCVCRLPDGRMETTDWISQDGADQMAVETEGEWERQGRRAVCVVVPTAAAPDAAAQAAAVAEVLAEEGEADED